MDHDSFIGEVQHRGDLATRGEADSATRAVLTALGERIQEDEAENLAAQLPIEIDRYLEEADSGQRFDAKEFEERVADYVELDSLAGRQTELIHAVLSVVADAAEPGEVQDLLAQFPEDEGYGRLLEFAESEDEIDDEAVPDQD